jgi:hypothetical protein
MKYRVLCHILVFFVCLGSLMAQTQDSTQKIPRTARNVVFVEGLGNGFLYSVNYERFLWDAVSLRAGFSAWTNNSDPQFIQDNITVPILINFLTSESEHNFEGGIGITIWQNTITSYPTRTTILAALRLGYRYQPLKGGFVFGIAFTPLFNPFFSRGSSGIEAWGGISLGWSF